MSTVAKNLRVLLYYLNLRVDDMVNFSISKLKSILYNDHFLNVNSIVDQATGQLIHELCLIRDESLSSPLSRQEVDIMISTVCL